MYFESYIIAQRKNRAFIHPFLNEFGIATFTYCYGSIFSLLVPFMRAILLDSPFKKSLKISSKYSTLKENLSRRNLIKRTPQSVKESGRFFIICAMYSIELHHLRCGSCQHHKYADISTQLKENQRKRMHRNVFSFLGKAEERAAEERKMDACISVSSQFFLRLFVAAAALTDTSPSKSHCL